MEENIQDPELLANRLLEEEEEFHHLNNPAEAIKPIIKKYLGIPKQAEQSENKIYFTDGDAKVEIVVVTETVIRVRLAPHGVFLEEFSYAVPKIVKNNVSFSLTEDDNEFRISTSAVNCHIRKKDFYISFSDSENNITSSDAIAMHWEENVKFGGYYVFCTKENFFIRTKIANIRYFIQGFFFLFCITRKQFEKGLTR